MKNLQITFPHTYIQKNVCKSYIQHSTSCIVYLKIKLCTHFINTYFPSTKAETLCEKDMQHNCKQRDNLNLWTAAKTIFTLTSFLLSCLWPLGHLRNWEGLTLTYMDKRGGRLPQTTVSLPGRDAVTSSCDKLLNLIWSNT